MPTALIGHMIFEMVSNDPENVFKSAVQIVQLIRQTFKRLLMTCVVLFSGSNFSVNIFNQFQLLTDICLQKS